MFRLVSLFYICLPQAASVIAGAGLTARVQLSLSCKGLANLDVGSKSDPFVVSAQQGQNGIAKMSWKVGQGYECMPGPKYYECRTGEVAE